MPSTDQPEAKGNAESKCLDECCSSKLKQVDSCCSGKATDVTAAKGCAEGGSCCSSKLKQVDSCCSGKATDVTAAKGCAEGGSCCSSKLKQVDSCCSGKATDVTAAKGCAEGGSCCSSKTKPSVTSILMPQSDGVESARFSIGGMTCTGCCTRVEQFLLGREGVSYVNVSLLTSRCDVNYETDVISPQQIEELIKTLGFEVMAIPDDCVVSIIIHVPDEQLEKARAVLLGTNGVLSVGCAPQPEVGDLPGGWLVQYDPDTVGARKLVREVSTHLREDLQVTSPNPRAGFDEKTEAEKFRRLLLWSCLLSLPVLFVYFVVPVWFSNPSSNPFQTSLVFGMSLQDMIGLICATPILFGTSLPIHESAISALRHGSRVTMDVLVSLSSFTAYGFSVLNVLLIPVFPSDLVGDPLSPTSHPKHETFFEVTVLLLTLILLGRWIESIVRARASHSIDALLRIQANTAMLIEKTSDGIKESFVDIALIERNDLLKILPGARVPTDGVVVKGESSIDESMITGESRKVSKQPGSIVIGGTINSQGVLIVRATHLAHESMLAQIIHLVDEAQTSKCPSQRVADKVSSVFTQFIITIAAVMFVVWYSLAASHRVDTKGWSPLAFALRFVITILVISCPCAISLAVPTAIMVGTTIGSQFGVLFKGGHALEMLEKVDVVMFDKTGTLTNGSLSVADVRRVKSGQSTRVDDDRLWQLVASVEQNSEHAIGRALIEFAQKHFEVEIVPTKALEQLDVVSGCGIQCEIEKEHVAIGSPKWVEAITRKKLSMDELIVNDQFQSQGFTVVCLAINHEIDALIALKDSTRDNAAFVIQHLQKQRIEPWIVTGDQKSTALAVAQSLGVNSTQVLANALPADKAEHVRLLQSLGKRVSFVGDGINDGPALAIADIGIAIGSGTDVAIESGEVVLIKDDLWDLLNAVMLSKSANRIIRWNFTWAFLYNAVMMPVACGVLYKPFGIALPPAFAGLSELFSSVPVVLFSLLLTFWKPSFRDELATKQPSEAVSVEIQEPTDKSPLLTSTGSDCYGK